MKLHLIFISLLFFSLNNLHAQVKKTADALMIDIPLRIDAVLDEDCYSRGIPATDFLQFMPYNGQPALQNSEVWYFYDHNALYVGAMLHDTSPDSIYNFLSERDDLGPADYFGVYIDPYNQGQLAYGFYITPSGVQTDMKANNDDEENEDESWDAVWESAARVTEKGWVVEMKIPYSALRFPEVSEHTWGMNMFRNIRRYNSNSSWSLIDRKISGFIDQQGELKGIRNIKPPVRLSLSPYAASYLELKGDPAKADFIYKGGLDLKYGINESFTLDMMLVPDFGQIQSDDKELNLTPYELFYDEKRQFFTEGTEMFARAGVFYSRRIGAAPKFAYRAEDALETNEVVDYNPSETQLLNATKISGRSSAGWGVGVLNAMTLSSSARLRDTLTGKSRNIEIQPFTNYNVAVIDKSLKNNSYVSLINTNIAMAGDPFFANSTAYDFGIKNKEKTYSLSGTGGVNFRRENNLETGYGGNLALRRIKGKFTFGIEQSLLSDKLNINDLGYMKKNNEVNTLTNAGYNITEPFGIFKEMHFGGEWNLMRAFKPSVLVANELTGRIIGQFRNNYVLGLFSGYHTVEKNYYEPHVAGRFFNAPSFAYISCYIETDSRKALTFETEMTTYSQFNTNGNGQMLESDLSLRLGQRFMLGFETGFENFINDLGFVNVNENEDSIWFARRNVQALENILEASFVLNNKMGINLRVRHYWSGADNHQFYRLHTDGSLIPDPAYTENQNQNYNAFTVDMRFRWIFAPGSELSLAWKNSILDETDTYRPEYFSNLRDTWNLAQTNSISLKLLYYIDYNKFASRK
jgi:hypothetical protein